MKKIEPAERWLIISICLLAGLAVLAPALVQPSHQHAFADQRSWLGIPCAADVVSNLAFAIGGLWGFKLLAGLRLLATQRRLAQLFFAGLLATAAASTWYHLQPNDAGLAIDRLGMGFAFAGLLGLAAAERISARAGAGLGAGVLLLAPLCVWIWASTDNVWPWLVLQFGGLALIAWMATRQAVFDGLVIRWGVVILIYAVAKALELSDHLVYDLSHQVLSGHTLKHLVASLAVWPVYQAIASIHLNQLPASSK